MPPQCSHQSCTMSALRGLRNGIYLGCQVRFTHSIAMAILFKKGSFKEKITQILENTFDHAKNLGLFVFIYKALICLIAFMTKNSSKKHALLAGAIAGYVVSRKKSQVKRQVVLYLLGRILFAGIEKLVKEKKIRNKFIKKNYFPLVAALTCGSIMFLFEDDGKNLTEGINETLKGLGGEGKGWQGLLPRMFRKEEA